MIPLMLLLLSAEIPLQSGGQTQAPTCVEYCATIEIKGA